MKIAVLIVGALCWFLVLYFCDFGAMEALAASCVIGLIARGLRYGKDSDT